MKILKITFLTLVLATGVLSIMSCMEEAKAIEKMPTTTANQSQWHDIQDLPQLQKAAPKKVLIDVYTDWCKWCKVMDQKTFSDSKLQDYLSQNYHLVKLNAETQTALDFKGKTYHYINSGRRGYNQLAVELLGGKLSYPSFVVLDEDLNTIDITRGYKDAVGFETYLKNVSQ